LDLFSLRVIGWAISSRLKKDLAIRADNGDRPAAAAKRLQPSNGQGPLIQLPRLPQKLLRQRNLRTSMRGKVSSYDNATVETIIKTIKAEMIWHIS
jgi:transposase InsO family protein